ncbi:MAG TPA: tetratricopeptide repeat protein [Thermoanaerobaculia bacterium]|nr:tetratricopeptide repeat protein [Thermoanaerobaculia bacterium]
MKFPEIGDTVGHFQLLEHLGRGGMGVVYKARDLRLGRLVALKFMTSDHEAGEAARRRFLNEARAASALDHPNVCTLFEIGETNDGEIFLAMAFCEGETLRSRLLRGPLESREAVEIAIQVADGLAAAHARGIVHRDVHPGNILIGDGFVKIVDFGVARLTDQTRITQDGVAVGTIAYAAPEQVCGEEVGPEADLWSLGIVLYQSIAGRLPFLGRSIPAMILEILGSSPPPLPGVSPDIERIVARALQKSPEQRYPSAEAMRADLRNAASGDPILWDAHLASTITPSTPALGYRPGPPSLHNLPFPQLGELLKGRSEDLQSLADALERGDPSAIHGLGGIGKTRLAVEYAWRHGSRYRAVLFVLSDSPEGLNSGLAALARADLLNLPERDDPAEREVVGAVLRWLRENPGWLLILDNVDTKEALLAVTRLLPTLARGRVLITSRRRDWPAGIHRHPVDVIQLEAAKDLLLQRTAHDRRKEPDDDAQALRLAELLDGLPLALEQAAAYIAHTQISLAEYLEVWESECDSVLGWYDEGVMQYPASLAVTWQRTFRQLTPTAQALLRLLAHLAPDPIPVEMLERGEVTLREAVQEGTPRPVREDLAELAALSLISRQGAHIVVHCMVQEVIRQRVPEESRMDWLELTLSLLSKYGPLQSDEPNSWPIWDLLRPHVAQVLGSAEKQGALENLSASQLMSCFGGYLYAKGLYSEAVSLLRTVLEIDERIFGAEHQEIAKDLTNLAVPLRAMNRFKEAEPLARRALKIDRINGERNFFHTMRLNSLAVILMDLRQWTEAEELLREALAIDEELDHSSVARDLHHLALLFTATGRVQEAEAVCRRSLEISREVLGEAHPKTARKLQVLAGILRDLGRTEEAEPLFRQAVEAFELILGPDHPLTRSARKDLEALAIA